MSIIHVHKHTNIHGSVHTLYNIVISVITNDFDIDVTIILLMIDCKVGMLRIELTVKS